MWCAAICIRELSNLNFRFILEIMINESWIMILFRLYRKNMWCPLTTSLRVLPSIQASYFNRLWVGAWIPLTLVSVLHLPSAACSLTTVVMVKSSVMFSIRNNNSDNISICFVYLWSNRYFKTIARIAS